MGLFVLTSSVSLITLTYATIFHIREGSGQSELTFSWVCIQVRTSGRRQRWTLRMDATTADNHKTSLRRFDSLSQLYFPFEFDVTRISNFQTYLISRCVFPCSRVHYLIKMINVGSQIEICNSGPAAYNVVYRGTRLIVGDSCWGQNNDNLAVGRSAMQAMHLIV